MGAAVMAANDRSESFARIVQALAGVRREIEATQARALSWGLACLVAYKFGGDPTLALSGARDQSSVLVRDISVYLAHVNFKLSHEAAGRPFNLSRPAATRAVQRIEDARDDAAFNWKLEQLELILGEEGAS